MREPDTAAAAGRTHGEQTDSGSYASHGFFPRLGLLPGAGTLELGGRIVREYHSSVPNEIDHPGSGDRAESRTSLAPAQPADRADDALIHVVESGRASCRGRGERRGGEGRYRQVCE